MVYLRREDAEKTKDFLVKLGKTVREIRLEKGLSQSQLAEQANVSTKYVGVLEGNANRLSNPSAALLRDLCDGLGLTLAEFFARLERRRRR